MGHHIETQIGFQLAICQHKKTALQRYQPAFKARDCTATLLHNLCITAANTCAAAAIRADNNTGERHNFPLFITQHSQYSPAPRQVIPGTYFVVFLALPIASIKASNASRNRARVEKR